MPRDRILGEAFNTLSPISDAFVNRVFFSIIQMIQLWHYWEIACSISINKIIFFIVIKSTKKWGDEVMKIASPIIQCSMVCRSKLPKTCKTSPKWWYFVNSGQCDQIGQFIGLWATFLKPLAAINLPKFPIFLCNFLQVSTFIIFLVKSFLGNFYRHLVIFSDHTDSGHTGSQRAWGVARHSQIAFHKFFLDDQMVPLLTSFEWVIHKFS